MDRDELWSEVLGSGYEEVSEWIVKEQYIDGDWDTPGTIQIVAEDPEEEGLNITVGIDADDLYKAYEIAVENGYTHCGKPLENQDFDACAGDIILQVAVYGETVFG